MADKHVGICTCRACEPEASLLWAMDSTMPFLAVRATFEDPFEAEEMALAAVLAATFDSASEDSRALLLASLSPPVDLRLFEAAIDESRSLLKAVATSVLLEDVRSIIWRTLGFGAADAETSASPQDRLRNRPVSGQPSALRDSPMAVRVADNVVDSVQFYANGYFDNVLLPTIRMRVLEILDATGPTSVPDSLMLQRAVNRAFTQRGYWRMLSNAATSRAYHYGLLKTASLLGRRGYRWHTVVDNRTSAVCLTMNGLEFWVTDAINALEGMAATGDPQAATKLMPWRAPEEIQGQSAVDLRAAGLLVPPAHPHCRSTLVVL